MIYMKQLFLLAIPVLLVTNNCNRTNTEKNVDIDINKVNAIEDSILKITSFTNKAVAEGSGLIADSVLFSMYIRAKYADIIKGNYKLDTDFKIGILADSYLEKGDRLMAFNTLKHFNECKFKISLLDSTIYFPEKLSVNAGPYERWAIYRVLSSIGNIQSFDNKMDLLQFKKNYLEIDTAKGMDIIKIDYYYENDLYYKEKGLKYLEYLEYLSSKYPEWKSIELYKKKYSIGN